MKLFSFFLAASLFAAEPNPNARTIVYNANEITTIPVLIRYATLIQFPEGENVVQIYCGDNEYMPIDYQDNVISIKAAKAGESTNVNVLATSGRTYPFLVKEVSQDPAAKADLKVLVKVPELDRKETAHQKYILATEGTQKDERIQSLEAQLKEVSSRTRQTVEQATVDTLSTIKHPYVWDQKKGEEIGLKSIWTDGKFTYVEVETQKLPSLSELVGGKEAALQYTNAQGVYRVDRVLGAGVLRSGKLRVEFKKGV